MSRNMRWWRECSSVAITLAAAATPVLSAPLMHHTFEDGVGGWTAFGTNGKVAVTREEMRVKEGKAALQYEYSVGKGQFSTLMLPTPDGAVAKARSFRFWVRADHPATQIMTLQEKAGGRYVAMFATPKEIWQQVELAPAEFILGDGPEDPKDPNGRLDLDQVKSIGILDIDQIFVQSEDANLRELMAPQMGPHTVQLDDFAVSDEALPEMAAAEGETVLDRFDRPQLQWLGIGDLLLSADRKAPASEGKSGNGLKAEYRQTPSKIVGLVRRLARGKLVGKERLLLDVASARATEIVVQVEEKGGGKYNKQLSIPGSSVVQKLDLPFSEFAAAADSKDDNGRLDLDQVTQLVIVDMSGFTQVEEGENTLRVSNLRASAAHAARP